MRLFALSVSFFVLLAYSVSGFGQNENPTELVEGKEYERCGQIRVIGNEPFSQLVISFDRTDDSDPSRAASDDYAISGKLHDVLWNKQKQQLCLRFVVLQSPIPGMPGEIEVLEILK